MRTTSHAPTPPGSDLDGDASDDHATPTAPTTRPAAAVAGVLAAASGVAAAELLAALVDGFASPVLAIGDRVVDGVPRPLKDLAIELFGTADKAALLVGIALVLALVAAGTGLLARTRRAVAVMVTAALGLVGAVATTAGGGGVVAAVPSLVAGAVAVAVLLLLVARLPRRATARTGADTDDDAPAVTGRRPFLATAGVAALAAAAAGGGGRLLRVRDAAATARAAADVTLPPPTTPVAYDLAAVAPDVAGLAPFETPNDDFYRIDTQLSVPRLDRAGWTLSVTGMVREPLELDLDELERRHEVVERSITMTCVSNEVGGGLVGNARWRGVRLADVLEDAGVLDGADQLVGRSFDGWTAGFPVSAAFDRDALLVVGMNDEPLPAAHGFPLRLVVPGLYGYVSATKWLTELEATTFDAFDAYWAAREWAPRAPIRTQSRIDVPGSFARVARGTVAVAGVAWAQTRGVERVEVRVDGGPWQDAELAAAHDDVTWRQWVFRWQTGDLEPGRHDLEVRATDGTGTVQVEEQAPPFPSGATGWHRVVVLVTDED